MVQRVMRVVTSLRSCQLRCVSYNRTRRSCSAAVPYSGVQQECGTVQYNGNTVQYRTMQYSEELARGSRHAINRNYRRLQVIEQQSTHSALRTKLHKKSG
jgi:hypothetical protein